jgi:hypothetical protein
LNCGHRKNNAGLEPSEAGGTQVTCWCRLVSTRTLITIDLSQVTFFDCRRDCFFDAGSVIDALTSEDSICIGFLKEDGGNQTGKVWVDRYTCQAGGRVIPP